MIEWSEVQILSPRAPLNPLREEPFAPARVSLQSED